MSHVQQSDSRRSLIHAVLLLQVLACGLPGTILEAAPTADANALSTIIAGTAAAAAAQTEAAAPAIQSPALEPAAIATLTPAVTSAPTFSTEGTALFPGVDGVTEFIDQSGGYELKVPAGWLLVRVNQQEFLNAWTLPEASDPKVRNFLSQVQRSDPKLFRLFGADTMPEHYQSGFVTNFNVFLDRSSTDSLDTAMGKLQEALPLSALHAAIIFAEVGFTSSRVPIGIIESASVLLTPDGRPLNLYQKQVVFRLRAGALTIVLSTTSELNNDYRPAFDTMVDQIVLMEK